MLQSYSKLAPYFNWKYTIRILIMLILVVTLFSYYLYLDYLYVIDDPYELRQQGPNELSLTEQLTIKVLAPLQLSDLSKFVEHYGICPVVQEIQVYWHDLDQAPPDSQTFFRYSSNHGRTTIIPLNNGGKIYITYLDTSQVQTTAIMFLDSDVYISCQDLVFVFSVWASSNGPDSRSVGSAVGLFPRLGVIYNNQEPRLYAGRDPVGQDVPRRQRRTAVFNVGQVYLQQRYNLLLSGGLLLHRTYVASLATRVDLKDILLAHPACWELLPSLYATYYQYLEVDSDPAAGKTARDPPGQGTIGKSYLVTHTRRGQADGLVGQAEQKKAGRPLPSLGLSSFVSPPIWVEVSRLAVDRAVTDVTYPIARDRRGLPSAPSKASFIRISAEGGESSNSSSQQPRKRGERDEVNYTLRKGGLTYTQGKKCLEVLSDKLGFDFNYQLVSSYAKATLAEDQLFW